MIGRIETPCLVSEGSDGKILDSPMNSFHHNPLKDHTGPVDQRGFIMPIPCHDALGMLEATGLTPCLVALDTMEKNGSITVLQAEVNDMLGVIIKIQGSPADVRVAIDAGLAVAASLGGDPVGSCINRPAGDAWKVIDAPAEYNPLIEQDVVWIPNSNREENSMNDKNNDALGLIETQGFTAVFEAIDTACKAANVEVVGKEKLGGGYVTVIIKGDVSAVKAAVESGSAKVDSLGKLIAAHVIARPSDNVLGLLPQ